MKKGNKMTFLKIFISILAFILIIFSAWSINVWMSPITGRMWQHRQINQADNMTFQYQHFFDLDATIQTQARNLKSAKKTMYDFNSKYPLKEGESEKITEIKMENQTTVSGLGQLCEANVQKYNHDAEEFTRNIFLDNKLPNRISDDICEGN